MFAFRSFRSLLHLGRDRCQWTTEQMVQLVRARREDASKLSLTQIRQRFDDLRIELPQLKGEVGPQSTMVDAVSLIAEVAAQTLQVQLYDVQIAAGLTMFSGRIAEMATGEGKTITAAIPAAMNALFGRGVHVITSNAYLAERDCKQLRPLFEGLGLTVGCLTARASVEEKRKAYACDITYGPGYEFGFDYLRDQIRLRQKLNSRLGSAVLDVMRGMSVEQETIQRPLTAAVVDEIDNVLIDDAMSPLVLSEQPPHGSSGGTYLAARKVAASLSINTDFTMNAADGTIVLSRAGEQKIWIDAKAIPAQGLLRPWRNYVEQALRAKMIYRRDVDYVVADGKIAIVDRTTGRIFADRTWRDGLHQAMETKENLATTAEISESARITRQRFFRLYPRLCGMTGTATGSESEFKEIYGLDVVPIPQRLPNQRIVLPSRFFRDEASKWRAICQDVQVRKRIGQPVLIGTRSIAKSEIVAAELRSLGIEVQVLNGKQDLDEAEVVAKAGEFGAVTIATNLAGRGTDIRPSAQSLAVGGLHVIATEYHDVGRIDRQLIGRSARQGEPGSAHSYVSADDDLLTRYGQSEARQMSQSTTSELAGPWEKKILGVQKRAENEGFVQRRSLNRNEVRHERLLGKLSGESIE